jgi:uncharacterized membrane protein YcjF (UPF0283 family)
MSEQSEYFDKFLAEKFQHIDESVQHIDQEVREINQKVDETVKNIDQKVEKMNQKMDQKVEKIIEDNKNTRRWIFGTVVGTGLTVLLGLSALLFSFVSIQNSWMQQVISFVGKVIVK